MECLQKILRVQKEDYEEEKNLQYYLQLFFLLSSINQFRLEIRVIISFRNENEKWGKKDHVFRGE